MVAMFRQAWFLARKDVAYALRARETLLWTFLMPIVFFYFIGTITSGFGGSGGVSQEPIAVFVPPDAGLLADDLIGRLERGGFQVVRVTSEQDLSQHTRALALPAEFTAAVDRDEPVKLRFSRQGEGMGTSFDEFRIWRATLSQLGDVILLKMRQQELSTETLQALLQQPRGITVAVEAAGVRQRIPTGFEQAIPGTMVMFTLLVMFTSGGIGLVIERNHGLLRRLASTPMSRGAIVLGKWLGKTLLGLIQIAFAMITGSLLFSMDWGPHLPALLLLMFFYGGLAATLGILLGNFSRTEGQVLGLGIVGTNLLGALGGCWWPIEVTPRWAQQLSLALPTGWAMDAIHKLVSFGAPPASVIPHMAAMLITAIVTGAVVARKFRFQ
jgi:ABC-type multidrug transport system permease subunit